MSVPLISSARLLAACLLAGALPANAAAQNKPVEFITAVPDAPAFTFLGTTPAKIERPGNLRDLGAAFVNGVGQDGTLKTGFAIDASVWNLIPGFDVPLESYRRSRLRYLLGNLQASIAVVQTPGDSSDMLGAIGFKTVIVDQSDPMLSDSVTQRLAAGLATCRPDAPGASASIACVDSVTSEVISAFTAERWNAAQLAMAVAFGSRFDGSRIDEGRYSGIDGWITGAVPFGTRIQLLGQATYRNRRAVDTIPAFQSLNLGARATMGSATFGGFLEYGREWRSPDDQPSNLTIDKTIGGWSAGIEFRLTANTWLSTGLGTRFESLEQPERTVVFANLKWGLTSGSRIGTLRS